MRAHLREPAGRAAPGRSPAVWCLRPIPALINSQAHEVSGAGSKLRFVIIIEPTGGLGNRMRAIDSAIAIADKMRRPLRVIWPISPELACGFDDLFERPGVITDVSELDFSKLRDVLRYRLVLPLIRRRNRAYRDKDHHWLQTKGPDFRHVGQRVLHYKICQPFYANPRPFAEFRPTGTLQSRIGALARPYSVGVHIRRSDNENAISGSPTERFVDLMKEEISHDPGVEFFLATDSIDEERTLRKLFPTRVRTQEGKALDRRTPQAARDALVDLFTLAACRKIIGSHFSSFTDVAAALRGVPLVIASTT